MKITFWQASEHAARVLVQVGEFHADLDGMTYYRHGEPACFVGAVLHSMGGKPMRWYHPLNHASVHKLEKWSRYSFTDEARFFLDWLQDLSDEHMAWGAAYREALHRTFTQFSELSPATSDAHWGPKLEVERVKHSLSVLGAVADKKESG